MNKSLLINQRLDCTLETLINDIKKTTDPIRKTILKKFLDIKIREIRSDKESKQNGNMDNISLDSLSDSVSDESDKKQKTENNKSKKSNKNTEISDIIKSQKKSLSELDKLTKIKAYNKILEDNKKEKDIKDIVQTRGKTESVWGTTYDPRYAKFAKEDNMNNRLMERLNTEIDFRQDGNDKIKIEKPFDDRDLDETEPFAKYEALKNNKVIIKKKNKKIGIRKPIY
jgi:hypothetical protein